MRKDKTAEKMFVLFLGLRKTFQIERMFHTLRSKYLSSMFREKDNKQARKLRQ